MSFFLPTLSLSGPVASCKNPHIPGCSAFKNAVSLTLIPEDTKYNVNSPQDTPNIKLLTSPA